MTRRIVFNIGMVSVALLTLLAMINFVHAQESEPQGVDAPQAALGTAFTYQGQLKSSGTEITGSCEMAFRLFDAVTVGNLIGTPITQTVTVNSGYFTVQLDFGASAFDGQARWLEIAVKCASDTGFTTLSRQELTAAPYAVYSVSTGALQGRSVSSTAPTNGQVLKYNGSAWAPGTDNDTTYTAGTGLNLSGGTFSLLNGFALPQTCSNGQHPIWNALSVRWNCGSDSTGSDWHLTGNSGTDPATNFIGTTDNQALVFRVNNLQALRIEPNATSPSIIGGYFGNSVTAGVYGATISGGGHSGHVNSVTGYYGTVGGGSTNTSGYYATVGGGFSNTAGGDYSTAGGGAGNVASGFMTTVGGGAYNTASGSESTVPGGARSTATHYGEMAYASGRFTDNGDAQSSLYVMRNDTTGSGWTDLYLDGTGERLTLASGRTMTFDILVAGRTEAGESAGYRIQGVIENVGGTTAFIGTPTVTLLGEDDAAWNAQVLADNTNDALSIQVMGNGETIRWVATVNTAEVAWVP